MLRILHLEPCPSRIPSWPVLQGATIRRHFGGQFGHSIDLMALPSNAMVDFQGSRLPFISPFPTPGCLGVNFFAQSPLHYPSNIFSNPYVLPPILLIPRVLRYLLSLSLPFTMVVPDVLPRCSWWPVIQAASHASIVLGQRGNTGLLLVPTKRGFSPDWSLPWDLWAFRFEVDVSQHFTCGI